MYIIRDREAGNIISKHKTWTEAMETLEEYENEDRKDNCYTEDFYEIVDEEDC